MDSVSKIRTYFRTTKCLQALIFVPILLLAQETENPNRFIFNGYLKDMQTVISQGMTAKFINTNLIHNRLNFKWIPSNSVTTSLEIRNRLVTGNILQLTPDYSKNFEVNRGLISLTKNIADQKTWFFNSSIDRLWLQYSASKLQLTIGRQRINWGQTFVWNPNDLFNTYSYFDFDYEEKPGSDAIRFQYYTTPTSAFELAVKTDEKQRKTIAGLYRFNRWNWDFQFLGGKTDQSDLVVGAGWSGQLLKGGFRGEVTYLHPEKNYKDTTGIFITSVSYDYTFKNSLFLQVEMLYSNNHESINPFSFDQSSNNSSSIKNIFLSNLSFFGSLSYPISPLVNTSLAGIVNPNNRIFFLIPTLNISTSTNTELSLSAQIIRYFGCNNSQDLSLFYFRIKASF